jgi:putative phosphoesterase
MKEDKRSSGSICIGVISDTHGMLRPQAVDALAGVDLILHAGDIDVPQVLEKLEQIAPVTAVCGNMDFGPLRERLAETEVVEAGDYLLYILHDIGRLDVDPEAAGFSAVVFGHSHRPYLEQKQGVLFLNPGSAGPKRFGKPVSVARIRGANGRLSARVIELDV